MTDSVDLGIPGLHEISWKARGGFGSVYSAKDNLNRDVAVKVLHQVQEQDVERFQREAEVAGGLSTHPNIVTVYAYGLNDQDEPYLVMEWMSGGSLADRLATEGSLPWPDVIRIAREVASALVAAHDEGVVHKDIKPENVLLSRHGVAALGDFGIAGFVDSTGTMRSAMSPQYSPPEAFEVRQLPDGRYADGRDERSDLYSLAATMFHLGTGELVFQVDSPSPFVWGSVIAEGALPALDHRGLDGFFATTLAKAPPDRPQTAREFVERLDELMAGGLPTAAIKIDRGVATGPSSSELERPRAVAQLSDAPKPSKRRGAPTTVAGVSPSALDEDEDRRIQQGRGRVRRSGAIPALLVLLVVIAGLFAWSPWNGDDGGDIAMEISDDPEPTATPEPEPTPRPTSTPIPTPTVEPTAAPTAAPTATVEPTPRPTAAPTATVVPSPVPSPTPAPEAAPAVASDSAGGAQAIRTSAVATSDPCIWSVTMTQTGIDFGNVGFQLAIQSGFRGALDAQGREVQPAGPRSHIPCPDNWPAPFQATVAAAPDGTASLTLPIPAGVYRLTTTWSEGAPSFGATGTSLTFNVPQG